MHPRGPLPMHISRQKTRPTLLPVLRSYSVLTHFLRLLGTPCLPYTPQHDRILAQLPGLLTKTPPLFLSPLGICIVPADKDRTVVAVAVDVEVRPGQGLRLKRFDCPVGGSYRGSRGG